MKPTRSVLRVEDIDIELVRSDVRHVRISVRPPSGFVRVSSPRRLSEGELRRLLAPRLAWIRRKQAEIRARELRPEPTFESGERHRVAGRTFRLLVLEASGTPGARFLADDLLELRVRPGSTREQRAAVLARWQRGELGKRAEALRAMWEARIGVKAAELRIKRMRTRWGSCNPRARRVWLNLELAAHADESLEYVVVHELVHLLEPSHGPRFKRLMDEHLPEWRQRRAVLHRGAHSPE